MNVSMLDMSLTTCEEVAENGDTTFTEVVTNDTLTEPTAKRAVSPRGRSEEQASESKKQPAIEREETKENDDMSQKIVEPQAPHEENDTCKPEPVLSVLNESEMSCEESPSVHEEENNKNQEKEQNKKIPEKEHRDRSTMVVHLKYEENDGAGPTETGIEEQDTGEQERSEKEKSGDMSTNERPVDSIEPSNLTEGLMEEKKWKLMTKHQKRKTAGFPTTTERTCGVTMDSSHEWIGCEVRDASCMKPTSCCRETSI